MPAGLTTPTYSVQVSFTDPFDTTDFVDITRFVRKGTTKRGRQHELQRPVAGTCSLTVSNQDGRFSTWNTTGPYVNVMTGADSYFLDNSIGTWTNNTNATLAVVATQGFDGLAALGMTAITGPGTMSATTATGTGGYPVVAGQLYGFQGQFKALTVARSVQVGVSWFNSGGTQIGLTSFGSSTNDATSVYSKVTQTGVAPAGAAFCALVAQVNGLTTGGEVHYFTRALISNGLNGYVTPGWAPGGRGGLVPARPVKVAATSGSTFPVFYGYIDSWLPSYGVMLSDQVINASDGLTLLALSYVTTSAYRQQLLADGANGYWSFADPAASASVADGSGNNEPLSAFGAGKMPTLGVGGLLFGTTATAGTMNPNSEISTPNIAYGASGGVTLEAVVQTTTLTNLTGLSVITFLGNLGAGYGLLLGGNATGTLTYTVPGGGGSGVHTVNDGKPHHIAVTVDTGGNWRGYVDGILDTSGSASVPSGTFAIYSNVLLPGGVSAQTNFTIAGAAVTPAALTQPQLAAHSALAHNGFIQQQSGQRIGAVLTALGISASLQSLATGISAVQAPTSSLTQTPALSHIQTVENTEQGFFYVDESGIFTYRDRHYILMNTAATTSNGTFSNDTNNAHFKFLPGLIPGMDELDNWNTVPVNAVANAALGVTGAIQEFPNADSVRWYGRRTLQGYSGMLQTTDTEAASLSQWLVSLYGLPIARVRSIKLDSTASNPSSLPQMLGRKLLDRITVSWQPIDGTAIPFTQDSLIENIQHDFTPELWTTTWGLSVAETQTYFTLNVIGKGVLGSNVANPGNRLGF